MPSTYSTDLRIELIATGEQSGTWGITTNNNLGTLVEQAIAGAANVIVASANQALTAFNGASDEARNAALVLTTTTTANFAVYVPPVTKLYAITNSSAYTATIYASTVLGNTTAAGTGVAIPAGQSALVRCDSINVVSQLSYVPGTLTAGGFSGPLTGNVTGNVTGDLTGNVTGNVSGSAGSAAALTTTNFSVAESGGKLYFYYGATPIATLDSAGVLSTLGDINSAATI